MLTSAAFVSRPRGRNSFVWFAFFRANFGKFAKNACRFILNGLTNANQILGEEVFNVEDWRVIGEYVYDDEGGRHQAFYSPVHDAVIFGETIKAHERIQVEQSLKYSQPAAAKLWNTAGLTEIDRWELGEEYGEFISGFVSRYIIIIPRICQRLVAFSSRLVCGC